MGHCFSVSPRSAPIVRDMTCSICLEDVSDENCAILECNHRYCKGCIDKWASCTPTPTCPTCRSKMENYVPLAIQLQQTFSKLYLRSLILDPILPSHIHSIMWTFYGISKPHIQLMDIKYKLFLGISVDIDLAQMQADLDNYNQVLDMVLIKPRVVLERLDGLVQNLTTALQVLLVYVGISEWVISNVNMAYIQVLQKLYNILKRHENDTSFLSQWPTFDCALSDYHGRAMLKCLFVNTSKFQKTTTDEDFMGLLATLIRCS